MLFALLVFGLLFCCLLFLCVNEVASSMHVIVAAVAKMNTVAHLYEIDGLLSNLELSSL